MMSDSMGRWYCFNVSLDTPFCLEKTGLPDHLAQMPSIDSPVPLSALLAELEDSGEAGSNT